MLYKPFYNYFEILWLHELSYEECVELLNTYAEIEGKENLKKKFIASESKLRAIVKLAGGNPRLIFCVYEIIVEDDLHEVEDIFYKMLDELSPYFREKMRDLPKQQKQIIEVIARGRKLMTPTEIAPLCNMPVNQVNSILTRGRPMDCDSRVNLILIPSDFLSAISKKARPVYSLK
ncbi:hypothetical protein LCGC14_3116790 [marine sediment metagenome]|uniref:Uncharacterized protein n=1 Tax=marine sediment metagenome TaxID=412755 RepID=A0A0F8YAX0_9ZZZZ